MYPPVPEPEDILIADERSSAPKGAACLYINRSTITRWGRPKWPFGFYVKGWLNGHHFKMWRLAEMKDGSFRMRIPSRLMVRLRLKVGDKVNISKEKDRLTYADDWDLFLAMKDEKAVLDHWYSLWKRPEQKHHYNEWLYTAKNPQQKADRLVRCLHGLRHRLDFKDMISATKDWKPGM